MHLTLNYWLIILGFLVLVLPAGEVIIKKKKLTWIGLGIILVGLATVVLTWLKTSNDIAYQGTVQKNDSTQRAKTDSILQNQREEWQKNAEFQEALFKEFKITRDSLTNRPLKQTFNTKIHQAETVNIGR